MESLGSTSRVMVLPVRVFTKICMIWKRKGESSFFWYCYFLGTDLERDISSFLFNRQNRPPLYLVSLVEEKERCGAAAKYEKGFMRLRYFQQKWIVHVVVYGKVKSRPFKMATEDVCTTEMGSSTAWLVERARQSLRENNPYEAKAWLITAKTLYPKDFGIQVRSLEISLIKKRLLH